jgi:hypothetical protein
MKNISTILSTLIAPEHAWKMKLFTHWPSIIGKLSSVVTIEKIDGSTLFLTVSHPTWAQELNLLTPMLLEKINACLPEKPIRAIRCSFKIKPKALIQHERIPWQKNTNEPTEPLSQQEEKVIASLTDNELQSTLAGYFKRCKAQKGRSRL